MGYLVAFSCFLIAKLSYIITRRVYDPIVFFSTLWGCIFLFASFRLFGLYNVSFNTWILLFIGNFSFVIGGGVTEWFFESDNKEKLLKPAIDITTWSINYTVLNIAIIIILIIYIIYSVQAIQLYLQGYTMDDVRQISFHISVANEASTPVTILDIVKTYIASPLQLTVIPLCIVIYIQYNKVKYLIFSMTIVFLSIISDGGRYVIAYFAIQLIVTFLIYHKKVILNKKNKKIIKNIFLVAIISIIVVTFFRLDDYSEIYKKYYRYFCGCIPLLDNKITYLDKLDDYSWGYASLYGLIQPMFFLFKQILGIQYSTEYLNTIDTVMNTQKFMPIGKDMATNAFVTPIYYLYADLGVLGIIIGMAFLGWISFIAFNKVRGYTNIKNIVFYLIIIRMLFKTIQLYPFSSIDFIVGLILFRLFFKRKGKNHIL